MSKSKRVILAAIVWLTAIALAALFDRQVATWMRESGIAGWMKSHEKVASVLKAPGEFYFTLAIAAAVVYFHPLRWRAGGFVLLATSVSGLNGLTKWIAGRTRPFQLPVKDDAGSLMAAPFLLDPFRGGFAGLFHPKNLCFPSGHAALAFATATAMTMLWPRAKWAWCAYVIATIVAAERVLENAHWLSDTVAGAAMGVGGVHLIHWIVMKYFPPEPESGKLELISESSAS